MDNKDAIKLISSKYSSQVTVIHRWTSVWPPLSAPMASTDHWRFPIGKLIVWMIHTIWRHTNTIQEGGRSIVGKTRRHVCAIFQACCPIYLPVDTFFFHFAVKIDIYKMDELPLFKLKGWSNMLLRHMSNYCHCAISSRELFACVIFTLFPTMPQSATFRADTKINTYSKVSRDYTSAPMHNTLWPIAA